MEIDVSFKFFKYESDSEIRNWKAFLQAISARNEVIRIEVPVTSSYFNGKIMKLIFKSFRTLKFMQSRGRGQLI